MDTEQARTFLAVASAGSFVAASERLHITQSTVSARIKALEEYLGVSLFVRSKSGADMTDAGRRFQKHAAMLVRTVEQARHDLGRPEGFRASIVIGARIGLWDGLLIDWLAEIRHSMPDVSIRAESGFEADLMQGLIDGRIDIGVMYTPQRRPNLELAHLMDEQTVLLSSTTCSSNQAEYIEVDWGPEFHAQHKASYPDAGGPALSVNIGWLGLQYMLRHGGSGYFPHRLAEDYIADGRMIETAGSPQFVLPSWLVYQSNRDKSLIDPLIDALRNMLDNRNI
ncbi:MAG: LysR family transcriptional regulator [Gammaproteobacteria bacterium]|nr:LysR family transcriptional regulator [Gammaproteobacteria bacterium]